MKKETKNHLLTASGLKPLDIQLKLSDNAPIPSKAHADDIGLDITAVGIEYDSENDAYIYHTGISLASDKHYGVYIYPRSSLYKKDAILCNHVAVIDSAIYRGEILLCFKCRTSLTTRIATARSEEFFNGIRRGLSQDEALKIADEVAAKIKSNAMKYAPYDIGDKIAQMIVFANADVNFIIHEGDWETTTRNGNGFGSSD